MAKQTNRTEIPFRSITDLKNFNDSTNTDLTKEPSLADETADETVQSLFARAVRTGHHVAEPSADRYIDKLDLIDEDGVTEVTDIPHAIDNQTEAEVFTAFDAAILERKEADKKQLKEVEETPQKKEETDPSTVPPLL